jgi:tRNA-2-methylthio-N6-dimethylallyladenosine synthase
MKYHIWTEGCQMNVADSQRVASALEHLGYRPVQRADEADVIVLNTCVVRQSAEDKAYGRLSSLRPLKQQRPTCSWRCARATPAIFRAKPMFSATVMCGYRA